MSDLSVGRLGKSCSHFICILAVDVVFDGFDTWLLEILWGDLDEIGYSGLWSTSVIEFKQSSSSSGGVPG